MAIIDGLIPSSARLCEYCEAMRDRRLIAAADIQPAVIAMQTSGFNEVLMCRAHAEIVVEDIRRGLSYARR
jgi:hypothetical protein